MIIIIIKNLFIIVITIIFIIIIIINIMVIFLFIIIIIIITTAIGIITFRIIILLSNLNFTLVDMVSKGTLTEIGAFRFFIRFICHLWTKDFSVDGFFIKNLFFELFYFSVLNLIVNFCCLMMANKYIHTHIFERSHSSCINSF